MKKYKCIIQDTFGKLEVGKIYYIEDNCNELLEILKGEDK